jgi:putative oxidoreductase
MQKCWHNKNIGLLIIRVVVGIVFIYFGWDKVSDMTTTVNNFSQMGFHAFWAYVASYVEFIGGIALVLGFGTKIVGILLAITMAVATYVVYPNGFMMASFPFTLLGTALGLSFIGGGKYSIGSCCGCPCKEGTCPVDAHK